MLIISYPHNPTTAVVDRVFFEKIRLEFYREHTTVLIVIHEFGACSNLVVALSTNLCYHKPPATFSSNPRTKEDANFVNSLQTSQEPLHHTPGGRRRVSVGNPKLVAALRGSRAIWTMGCSNPSRSPPSLR